MTYAFLCQGKTEQEINELDLLLAPDEEARQLQIDRANAAQMRMMGIGMVGPRPKPRGG